MREIAARGLDVQVGKEILLEILGLGHVESVMTVEVRGRSVVAHEGGKEAGQLCLLRPGDYYERAVERTKCSR
jgi:hypothetical protein